jgi:hypothetical protein
MCLLFRLNSLFKENTWHIFCAECAHHLVKPKLPSLGCEGDTDIKCFLYGENVNTNVVCFLYGKDASLADNPNKHY